MQDLDVLLDEFTNIAWNDFSSFDKQLLEVNKVDQSMVRKAIADMFNDPRERAYTLEYVRDRAITKV